LNGLIWNGTFRGGSLLSWVGNFRLPPVVVDIPGMWQLLRFDKIILVCAKFWKHFSAPLHKRRRIVRDETAIGKSLLTVFVKSCNDCLLFDFTVRNILGGPTKVKPTYIFVCKI